MPQIVWTGSSADTVVVNALGRPIHGFRDQPIEVSEDDAAFITETNRRWKRVEEPKPEPAKKAAAAKKDEAE